VERYSPMAIKFTFLILPQIHLLDLAGADQAIHEAIEYNADFKMEYCGLSENANVTTTGGLTIGRCGPGYS
jgi:transcriptional regulator GlxA family with amidase domain